LPCLTEVAHSDLEYGTVTRVSSCLPQARPGRICCSPLSAGQRHDPGLEPLAVQLTGPTASRDAFQDDGAGNNLLKAGCCRSAPQTEDDPTWE